MKTNEQIIDFTVDETSPNEFILENRHFGVESAGEGLSENELANFEEKIGMRLPLQLREYYF